MTVVTLTCDVHPAPEPSEPPAVTLARGEVVLATPTHFWQSGAHVRLQDEAGVVLGYALKAALASYPLTAQKRYAARDTLSVGDPPDARPKAYVRGTELMASSAAFNPAGLAGVIADGKLVAWVPAADLRDTPVTAAELLSEAFASVLAGNTADAVARAREATQLEPDDVSARRLLAVVTEFVDGKEQGYIDPVSAQDPEATGPAPLEPPRASERAHVAGVAVRLHSKPATTGKVSVLLPFGTAVEVISVDGDWARVKVKAPTFPVAGMVETKAMAPADGGTAAVVPTRALARVVTREGFVQVSALEKRWRDDAAAQGQDTLQRAAEAFEQKAFMDASVLADRAAALGMNASRVVVDASLRAGRFANALNATPFLQTETPPGLVLDGVNIAFGCRGALERAELVEHPLAAWADRRLQVPADACAINLQTEAEDWCPAERDTEEPIFSLANERAAKLFRKPRVRIRVYNDALTWSAPDMVLWVFYARTDVNSPRTAVHLAERALERWVLPPVPPLQALDVWMPLAAYDEQLVFAKLSTSGAPGVGMDDVSRFFEEVFYRNAQPGDRTPFDGQFDTTGHFHPVEPCGGC